jgi:hypothetical protein
VSGGNRSVAVRGWWVLVALLVPFGWGTGPSFWYAARRARMPAWAVAGAVWLLVCVAGYGVALATKHDGTLAHPLGLAVMFAGWGGAFVHALVIRPAYVRRVAPLAATAQARADDAEARRIAREEPRLAAELRSGSLRPAMGTDLERADDVKPWWVLLTAVPLGFGAGPAFLYAAVRARSVAYAVYGVIWLAVCLTGLVLTLVSPEDSDGDQFGSFLMVMTWIVACGQAFALRKQYVRRVRARETSPIEAARERLRARDEARRIAAENPRLALEMGIGRPDRGPADDGGLIDVNHVPEAVLVRLPGVDRALARRIALTRREIRGFSSVEDLGTVLDLAPDMVEEMRERAIFLPRG